MNFAFRKWRKEFKTRGHFQNWTSAILDIFLSGYFHKRNAHRHVVTSLRAGIYFSGQQNLWRNLVSKLHLAWIMAEIVPYSFEPMRDSSESEEDDVHESQDERRRRNTSWCTCVYAERCANWEGQQEKECLCCKEIEEAVNKISGE